MSTVVFASVVRVKDGLPLSASTDYEQDAELQETKRHLKTLSKKLGQLPDRCCLKSGPYNVNFTSSLGVGYLMVCSASYPNVLSFCFLDELQREFIITYDPQRISSVVRPYSFIEFGSYSLRLEGGASRCQGEVQLQRPGLDWTPLGPGSDYYDYVPLEFGSRVCSELDCGSALSLEEKTVQERKAVKVKGDCDEPELIDCFDKETSDSDRSLHLNCSVMSAVELCVQSVMKTSVSQTLCPECDEDLSVSDSVLCVQSVMKTFLSQTLCPECDEDLCLRLCVQSVMKTSLSQTLCPECDEDLCTLCPECDEDLSVSDCVQSVMKTSLSQTLCPECDEDLCLRLCVQSVMKTSLSQTVSRV
uniref:Longin domain-containing protein n=1 Tax=Knipowitschia caucasica TaxID=637954 RepID=A0AAV2K0A9_KNICA